MKEIEVLKNVFKKENSCCSEEEYIAKSEAKLTQILQKASLDDAEKDRIDAIKAFLSANDIQRNKLLSYCFDFFDPTVATQQTVANGVQIQQHKFLNEDEIKKLHGFVKRHLADKSFGDTVYEVMDKHNMTSPEVYKNAMLRRQDFSRATAPNNQKVTRRLAWQIIIGLHCSLEEADEVLFSAGFVRMKTLFDSTMEYFIRNKNYDIMAINEVLYNEGMKPYVCEKSVSDKENR